MKKGIFNPKKIKTPELYCKLKIVLSAEITGTDYAF